MTSLRFTITKANAADKLREARALIEKGWTQGAYAKTSSGRPIGYEEANATCWCSLGALFRATPLTADARDVCDALMRAIGHENIVQWNDDLRRTQAEVLAAFDKAIELAEKAA